MKPHRIIKKFKGTQTGHGDGEFFEPGTVADLSDTLAEAAVKAGFAVPHGETSRAEDRETKVIVPDEVKEVEAEEQLGKRKKRA